MIHILGYITWDVSPFIYEGEHFAIGWYGTLWTLGLLGMLVTLLITFKHDGVPSQFALITFMVSLEKNATHLLRTSVSGPIL